MSMDLNHHYARHQIALARADRTPSPATRAAHTAASTDHAQIILRERARRAGRGPAMLRTEPFSPSCA